MRLTLCLLLLLAVAAAPAEATEGRRVVVVLDRGADAERGATGDAGNAVRLMDALLQRGLQAELLVVGADAKGRPHLLRPEASMQGIRGLGAEGPFTFRGPTDPRDALKSILKSLAAAEERPDDPIDVIFIGAFSAPLKPPEKSALTKVMARWSEQAPAGSRLLPVAMTSAPRAMLEGAKGLVPSGQIVIGVAEPEIRTAPFSPLAAEDVPRNARVRMLVDWLRVGGAKEGATVLDAHSDVAEDRITTKTLAGLHDFHVQRRGRDGNTATLSFRPHLSEGTLWICAAPKPLTFRWETLRPDARLVGPDGESSPTFTAIDVEAAAPHSVAYRLQRSLSGPTPAWRAATRAGPLPAGLTVTFGEETHAGPEIAETEVRVSYRARAGRPAAEQGTLLLSADGMPAALELPFETRVQPGRGVLTLVTGTCAVPAAANDVLPTLTLEARNGNMLDTVLLEATCAGGQAPWLTARVRSPQGLIVPWPLAKRLPLAVGSSHTLAFQLDEGAPGDLTWPCEVTIRPVAQAGVEIEGQGTVSVRRRQPRLRLVSPSPAFLVVDGEFVAEHPFLLKLDADGGDGDWLLRLLSTKPTVTTTGGTPLSWQVVGQEAGTWRVAPDGLWEGRSPKIFTTVKEQLSVRVTWGAGSTPGTIEVPIQLTPRWGKKGYILVVLAGLALLLAVLIFFQMRTVALSGTLIYTVKGLEGTVGRLDLSAAGRGVVQVRSDGRGRLSLGREGELVVRILPTRVGGLLEVPGSASGRRLLVDGLSLRAGRHLLRYVSGQPQATEAAAQMEEVPDLLGPEFDLDSGRIEGLGNENLREGDPGNDDLGEGHRKDGKEA